jgi:hypothetical protein
METLLAQKSRARKRQQEQSEQTKGEHGADERPGVAGVAVPPAMVPAPQLSPPDVICRWAGELSKIIAHLRTRPATAAHAGGRSPPLKFNRLNRVSGDEPRRPTGSPEHHPYVPTKPR